MRQKDDGFKIMLIIAVLFLIGIIFGRIVRGYYNRGVQDEIEKVLNRVIMIDVPPIDKEVSLYLTKNEYRHKYLTAIDLSDMTYGIYEIEDNDVIAYAHGKCVSIGDTKIGTYKIVNTKSHYDYHDARYWDIVELEEIHTGDKLIVSTPPYEIADAPIEKSDVDDLGGVEIGSESMLSVYDNGDKNTILLVIDSKNDKYVDGINHNDDN
jgi:hypothetical protein